MWQAPPAPPDGKDSVRTSKLARTRSCENRLAWQGWLPWKQAAETTRASAGSREGHLCPKTVVARSVGLAANPIETDCGLPSLCLLLAPWAQALITLVLLVYIF